MTTRREKLREYEPVIRIGLRYIAMYLVTDGYIAKEAGQFLMEPAVIQMLAGLVIMLITEVWYRKAKKAGKPT